MVKRARSNFINLKTIQNGRIAMTKRNSSIWAVPAHITGVFRIVEHENPLMMGSRGAGFSISRRINTRVRIDESERKKIDVLYNNKKIDGKVSLAVAKNFEGFSENTSLIIEHKSDLPIQAGFGTSGAGAIGTALAFNEFDITNSFHFATLSDT